MVLGAIPWLALRNSRALQATPLRPSRDEKHAAVCHLAFVLCNVAPKARA
jgi:hypothetical protein